MFKVIFILVLSICNFVFAQNSTNTSDKQSNSKEQEIKEKPKKRGDEPKYLIRNKFPFDVFHIYRMNEKSEVKRTFKDGTVKEFTRDVSYYYTLRRPDLDKEGFSKVNILIDSIMYKYKSGDKIVQHNTQEDKMPPINFPDYVYYMIQISKQFDVTYSPYGDVASISGDLIESIRNDYTKIEDTARRDYYLRRLSDFDLIYIVDMTKHTLPLVPMELDTTWKHNYEFELEGLRFTGKANSHLVKANSTKAVIECITDTLRSDEKIKKLFDMDIDATIDSSYATCTYTLDVKGDGALEYSKALIEGTIKGKANGQPFTEKIKRTIIWDLIERYKY